MWIELTKSMNSKAFGKIPALAAAALASGIFCTAWTAALAQQQPADLDDLRKRYDSHLSLLNRPLIELGNNYEQALGELKNELQSKADLDGLVVLTEEIARFKKDRLPAPETSKFEPLARLQTVFATHRETTKKNLQPQLQASHSAYRKQLTELMNRLTAAGEVAEALKVRSTLKQLSTDPEGKPTLETGLVLHLRFENETGEVIRDLSGSENHGRLMGDASNHSTGEARRSYAVLDGRGDFIECAHADSLALSTDGSISIWVRPKRLQSMRGLVSKYNPEKSYTLRTWKEGEQSKVAFGDTSDNFISTPELRENRWTHVAVTLDQGDVSFYFNGKLNSEGSRDAPLPTNTSPVRIGSDYDGRYFNGAVDDVRIYNRALSAQEIAEIFRIES
jgi:hypothetical protein